MPIGLHTVVHVSMCVWHQPEWWFSSRRDRCTQLDPDADGPVGWVPVQLYFWPLFFVTISCSGQISTNEPMCCLLGRRIEKTLSYLINVVALQPDSYKLSCELPSLAFVFSVSKHRPPAELLTAWTASNKVDWEKKMKREMKQAPAHAESVQWALHCTMT